MFISILRECLLYKLVKKSEISKHLKISIRFLNYAIREQRDLKKFEKKLVKYLKKQKNLIEKLNFELTEDNINYIYNCFIENKLTDNNELLEYSDNRLSLSTIKNWNKKKWHTEESKKTMYNTLKHLLVTKKIRFNNIL